jgi:hypothetical protein
MSVISVSLNAWQIKIIELMALTILSPPNLLAKACSCRGIGALKFPCIFVNIAGYYKYYFRNMLNRSPIYSLKWFSLHAVLKHTAVPASSGITWFEGCFR